MVGGKGWGWGSRTKNFEQYSVKIILIRFCRKISKQGFKRNNLNFFFLQSFVGNKPFSNRVLSGPNHSPPWFARNNPLSPNGKLFRTNQSAKQEFAKKKPVSSVYKEER